MERQLRHSLRQRLTDPTAFLWCTGIEDTFITSPHPTTGRTLDEYELTGHYARYHDDLGLIAALGVKAARYGIPWHRINPQRGSWDWEWTDRALDRLLNLGVEPILDLVHYGLPAWIDQAFLHPDFPEFMAEYAGRVAERYKDRITAYTPLNEPRITAWYCGRIGWWPPFKKSWAGFAAVTTAVARGIVRTVETIRSVDADALIAHVDATDLYVAAEPSLEAEAKLRQELVFLALDLVSGRVSENHFLRPWLAKNKVPDETLAWFSEHRVDLPLVGINLYPMFTYKTVMRTPAGRTRIRMSYAGGELIRDLGRLYWQRYGAPIFISETASVGSVRRRSAWLEDSIVACRKLREEGVPLIGYTWWPLFALVTWGYRQGRKDPPFYLKQMGLWDLDSQLERVPTPLVERFQHLCRGGADEVGLFQQAAEPNTSTMV